MGIERGNGDETENYSELDILISEKIMGGTPPKRYSSHLPYALEVIDEVTGKNWIGFSIVFRPKQADMGDAWKSCKYIISTTHGGQGTYPGVEVFTLDLPKGICIAAAMTFKIDVKKHAKGMRVMG